MLDKLINIAQQAGQAIIDIYKDDSKLDLKLKADFSPLTAADLGANAVIIKALKQLTPNIPILSEEQQLLPYAKRKLWKDYWLIDPLDGTKEFLNKKDEFTVNIALIKQQQPVIGIVYAPALEKLYYAQQGKGAYLQQSKQIAQQITTRATPKNKIKEPRAKAY